MVTVIMNLFKFKPNWWCNRQHDCLNFCIFFSIGQILDRLCNQGIFWWKIPFKSSPQKPLNQNISNIWDGHWVVHSIGQLHIPFKMATVTKNWKKKNLLLISAFNFNYICLIMSSTYIWGFFFKFFFQSIYSNYQHWLGYLFSNWIMCQTTRPPPIQHGSGLTWNINFF
jgi:hypothetical protein